MGELPPAGSLSAGATLYRWGSYLLSTQPGSHWMVCARNFCASGCRAFEDFWRPAALGTDSWSFHSASGSIKPSIVDCHRISPSLPLSFRLAFRPLTYPSFCPRQHSSVPTRSNTIGPDYPIYSQQTPPPTKSVKMMSLRAVARTAAPRALRAVSASPITLGRATIRATSNVLRTQLPQKAFSTTVFRAAATEIDSELSEKLSTEIGYEQDIASNEPVPATVKDFLENGPFELVDTPGKEDVVLKRTFGNEQ